MDLVERLKKWATEELNPKEKFKELKELGKKHGPGFLAYEIGVELFEDVILPGICIAIGRWELAPICLALHLEPVAYPAYFGVVTAVNHYKKRG